jgi:proteasome accessory factor A
MEKYGPAVVAASWDSVIFEVPGKSALQRLPLLDPLKGTQAQVGAIIDASADVVELFENLDH